MQRNLVLGFFLKRPTVPPSGLCETEISLSSTPVVPRDYFLGRVLQHLNQLRYVHYMSNRRIYHDICAVKV